MPTHAGTPHSIQEASTVFRRPTEAFSLDATPPYPSCLVSARRDDKNPSLRGMNYNAAVPRVMLSPSVLPSREATMHSLLVCVKEWLTSVMVHTCSWQCAGQITLLQRLLIPHMRSFKCSSQHWLQDGDMQAAASLQPAGPAKPENAHNPPAD